MNNLALESLSLATVLSNMSDDNLLSTFNLLSYEDSIRISSLLQQSKTVIEKEVYVLLRSSCYDHIICPLLQKFLIQYTYYQQHYLLEIRVLE